MKRRQSRKRKLAEMIGLRQSAIANLLARDCRPQRRTVKKLAEALDVPPSALWPSWSDNE